MDVNLSTTEKILVEQMSEAVYIRDLDMNLLYINPASEKLTGFSREEAVGMKCYEVFGDADLECKNVCPVDKSIAESLPILHHDGKLKTRKGDTLEMRMSISPIVDQGKVTSAVVVIQDITRLREVEKTNVKALISLQQERSIFENGPVAVFKWKNLEGWPVEYASKNVLAITGYTREEWIEGSIKYSDLICCEDLDRVKEEVKKNSDNGTEHFIHQPYRLIKKDGETIWVDDYTTILRDREGSITHYLGYVINTTDTKQVEKALHIQRDLAVDLSSANNLEGALTTILEANIRIEQIDCGGIYLVDKTGGELRLVVHSGLSREFIKKVLVYPLDAPQVEAVNNGKPIYGNFYQVSHSKDKSVLQEGLRAIAVIPVWNKGKIVAVINLASRNHDHFSKTSRDTIETLATQIGGVISRVEAEERERHSQEQLRLLFDTIDDFLFILDNKGQIIRFNPVVVERLGYSPEELLTMNVSELHPPEQRQEAMTIVTDLLDGKLSYCPVPLYAKDTTRIPVETKVSRGTWEGKEVLFGISRDITEHLEAEKAWRSSEDRLRTAIEALDEGFVIYDPDDRLVMCNTKYQEIYHEVAEYMQAGIKFEDLVRRGLELKQYPEAIGREEEWLAERLAMHCDVDSNRVQRLSNDRWVKIAERKTRDGSTVGFRVDITELKRTETELQSALKEKDALLREIHHRVKNNMAVVSSLINLQAKRVEEPLVKEALQESQNRVKSMALVHETLYRSDNLSQVDLQAYCRQLVSGVASIYQGKNRLVAIEVEADGITLPIDQAVPCGIIINELITNSLKYGFPDGRSGTVLIVAGVDSENWYTLSVRDNGVGLASDFDVKNSKSLGLRLVTLMADQLNGTIQIKSEGGVRVLLRWPRKTNGVAE